MRTYIILLFACLLSLTMAAQDRLVAHSVHSEQEGRTVQAVDGAGGSIVSPEKASDYILPVEDTEALPFEDVESKKK